MSFCFQICNASEVNIARIADAVTALLSTVTLNCQVTKIVMNSNSQL